MEVCILASGSSGNAVLVSSGGTSVLLDAGISALQLRRRLEAFGHDPATLDAVILTHEHSDHVRGLEVLLKRHPLPVWASGGTWSALDVRSDGGGELRSGRELRIGSLRLLPVATSHDAREPVAVVVDDGHRRVALCTDTGIMTSLLEQRLAGADLLLLEANHDPDLLRHGPYPWPLKQRIASRLGHLSNHQAAESLARIGCADVRAVVGLHLSAENNTAELVGTALRQILGDRIPVTSVTRTEMLGLSLDDSEPVFERIPIPARGGIRG